MKSALATWMFTCCVSMSTKPKKAFTLTTAACRSLRRSSSRSTTLLCVSMRVEASRLALALEPLKPNTARGHQPPSPLSLKLPERPQTAWRASRPAFQLQRNDPFFSSVWQEVDELPSGIPCTSGFRAYLCCSQPAKAPPCEHLFLELFSPARKLDLDLDGCHDYRASRRLLRRRATDPLPKGHDWRIHTAGSAGCTCEGSLASPSGAHGRA